MALHPAAAARPRTTSRGASRSCRSSSARTAIAGSTGCVRRRADGQAVGLVETTVSPDRQRVSRLLRVRAVPAPGLRARGVRRDARATCVSTAAWPEVDAEVDTRNDASQRLMAALGFARDDGASSGRSDRRRAGVGLPLPARARVGRAQLALQHLADVAARQRVAIRARRRAAAACRRARSPRRAARRHPRVAPGAGTTNATGVSPHRSDGTPTTATSCTDGCVRSTASRSLGYTLKPPEMIMSLRRSSSTRKPSSSKRPRSPVRM